MARTSPFDLNQRDLFIRSYAEKSVGANETLRQLRDAGFSMGRSAFLDAYRTYAGITKKENSIKYTPNKYRIAPENYTEARNRAISDVLGIYVNDPTMQSGLILDAFRKDPTLQQKVRDRIDYYMQAKNPQSSDVQPQVAPDLSSLLDPGNLGQ